MQKYISMVEKHRQKMLDAMDYIWKHPESGYREWNTHSYMKAAFEDMGYSIREAGNIPGFTALVDTGRPGPTVAVFGEMDSLINFDHPACNPETGAVHSCGHCAQAAALIGLAAALKEPGALDEMSGKILLVAVPAEELIEIEYRLQLRKEGKIRYFGGKPEFLYRGLLDGVDLSFMIHTACQPSHSGSCAAGTNGLVAKTVEFSGVAAHAGSSPHLGVNALYAANLSLNAINALRETFHEKDHIRVHPIITAGGDAVNAIPDRVRMECYVRGATVETIAEANRKVNRAIAASAVAMGAKVRITDIPGYLPRYYGADYREVFRQAMGAVLETVNYDNPTWGGSSSDMGDITSIMPGIHPHIGGAKGISHGSNYEIADPDTAVVDSAKVQMVALKLLLENGAAQASKIVANYRPVFASKEAYFAFVDGLAQDVQAVTYSEDGSVQLRF